MAPVGSVDPRATVAATLREIAEWSAEDRSPDELLALAVQVEAWDGYLCCPLCQEVRCDGCPLEPVNLENRGGGALAGLRAGKAPPPARM